jgi:hypothetical protein
MRLALIATLVCGMAFSSVGECAESINAETLQDIQKSVAAAAWPGTAFPIVGHFCQYQQVSPGEPAKLLICVRLAIDSESAFIGYSTDGVTSTVLVDSSKSGVPDRIFQLSYVNEDPDAREWRYLAHTAMPIASDQRPSQTVAYGRALKLTQEYIKEQLAAGHSTRAVY